MSRDEHKKYIAKLIGVNMSRRRYDGIMGVLINGTLDASIRELIHIANAMPERLNVNFTDLINPDDKEVYDAVQSILPKEEEVC